MTKRLAKSGFEGVADPSDKVKEHPLISGQTTVGLLTGENPAYPTKSMGGFEGMQRELSASGLKFEPTEGRYGAPERSFIVYGPSREQLFDLGHRYGQESVIYSQGGKHELLYTNGHNTGLAHPSVPKYEYFPDEAPPDYYTKLPSTGGYLRLSFDGDTLNPTPLRSVTAPPAPMQHPVAQAAGAEVKKHSIEDVRVAVLAKLRKALEGATAHGFPHAYDWHDGHTDHHLIVRAPGAILVRTRIAKAEGDAHPHMDGPPVVPPPPPKPGEAGHENDQAAGVGVSTYPKYAAPYGSLDKGRKTDLFHYPMHGKLADVQALVKQHGFTTYYAGGKYGRPDLAARNYNTGHLMVYDPTPSSGGDFGDRDYTDAWRQTHELAHALTYPELNQQYGEGRRLGKLGTHRTLNEALRAVHWEWLAAHKQRDLSAKIGVQIPDDVFHRELNTVMHDAVHRAVTGKFTEPSEEGFLPHSHKVPLETALGMVRDAAHQLGLKGQHDTLVKAEAAILPNEHGLRRSSDVKTYSIPEVRTALAKTMKDRIASFSEDLRQLRVRELSKAELLGGSCAICGKESCDCLAELRKSSLCAACSTDPCKCEGVLPDDKKSKDVTPKKSGHGGIPGRGKKLGKGETPAERSKRLISEMDAEDKANPKPICSNCGGEHETKTCTQPSGRSGKPFEKADVPMAAAPTKEGTAPHPTSKAGSPKVGAAPKPVGPVMKSESRIPGRRLAKAAFGGNKDMQMMASHDATKAAVPGASTIPGKVAKPTMDQHAARAQQFTDFTPKGAFAPAGAGAAAGAMKPAPTPPAGLGHVKSPTPGVVGKPMGSAATPSGGLLGRFHDALHGRKSAGAPAMKSELQKAVPRYLWPLDRQRDREPMGHAKPSAKSKCPGCGKDSNGSGESVWHPKCADRAEKAVPATKSETPMQKSALMNRDLRVKKLFGQSQIVDQAGKPIAAGLDFHAALAQAQPGHTVVSQDGKHRITKRSDGAHTVQSTDPAAWNAASSY